MNNLLKTFLISGIILAASACKQDKESEVINLPPYPKYEQIVNTLLEDYSFETLDSSHHIRLSKKQDGWHVEEYAWEKNEENLYEITIVKEELFWSFNKKNYQKIGYPLADGEEKGARHSRIESELTYSLRQSYYFDHLPAYGYDGWFRDIIDHYGDKTNLSDTMLNALARAYAHYAVNLLGDRYGSPLKELHFELPEGQNALSPEQLETFRKYAHKSCELYDKLRQLNPDFETVVGPAYIKYSNEIVNNYLLLLIYQNREEALKEMKEGLYDEKMFNMSMRYLNSCDSNAILFTSSDNDTYPLLYIQEMMDYRTDVSVINTNLLFDKRYISHLRKPDFVIHPVVCQLSDPFYTDNFKEYISIIDEGSAGSMSVAEFLQFIALQEPADRFVSQSADSFYYSPVRNLYIDITADEVPRFEVMYHEPADFLLLPVFFSLKTDQLSRSQMCMLDIISTNRFRRPVYFTYPSAVYQLGMEHHLQEEGMVYKLTPFRYRTMNTDVQYDILMNKIALPFPDKAGRIEDNRWMLWTIRRPYTDLAVSLYKENDKERTLEVLEYLSEELGENKGKPDYNYIQIALLWFLLENEKKGNRHLDNYLKVLLMEKDDPGWSSEAKLEVIRQMKEMSDEYSPESGLNRKLEKIIDTWDKD